MIEFRSTGSPYARGLAHGQRAQPGRCWAPHATAATQRTDRTRTANMDASELTEWYKRGRRDFAGSYLVEAEMTGFVLSGSDLSGADLRDVNLASSELNEPD